MTHVIIMAGGKGTRMKSEAPKVLTSVRGVPIIERVLSAVLPVCLRPTVIVGHGADAVRAVIGDRAECVLQEPQLGTGHAVLTARPGLVGQKDIDTILVLNGDHPLITTETLAAVVRAHETIHPAITMATVKTPDFSGDFKVFEHFGRVLRDGTGMVRGIREWKDANPEERAIAEVNPAYYCFTADWLWGALDELTNNNQSHEYYLTDLIQIAFAHGEVVQAVPIRNPIEGMGVNTPEELAIVERYI